MKDEKNQKEYCIVISIIGLILGIIGFITEYFIMNKFDIKEAIRITDDNFSFKKGVKYIPAYALFCLKDII